MKLLCSIVLLSVLTSADVTARGSFAARKSVAFNAAVQAVDMKWHLRNSNSAHGDLWFITTDKLQDAPFDAGVLIQEKDGQSDLELVLRPLKKEPKQADADQILAQLLKSMAGRMAAPAVTGLINRDGASESILPAASLEGVYAAAKKVALQQGHLVRSDAAAREIVFISTSAMEPLSLGLTLADQFGDVRISAKHWRPNGSRVSNETYADQAFADFIEALESELNDQVTTGN